MGDWPNYMVCCALTLVHIKAIEKHQAAIQNTQFKIHSAKVCHPPRAKAHTPLLSGVRWEPLGIAAQATEGQSKHVSM